MKSFTNKKTIKYLAISAGVNLLVAALAIFVFGVNYVVDDDPSMSYLAYGIFAEPSAKIVFSNVIFGEAIKLLFQIKPSINWQVALYFAGLCFGGFVSLLEILRVGKSKLVMLWTAFVICFFYTSFCEVTFTIVAAYICAQGFFAFFLAIKQEDKLGLFLGGAAIFYASLIRFLSVMAVAMFIFVAWILIVAYEYENDNSDIKERIYILSKRYVMPFLILVLVLGVGFGIDRLAYSTGDWASYDKYNNLRSDILDNASIIVDDDYEKQAELGITPAMAASLKAWKFNDPEVFDENLFGQILEVSLENRSSYSPHPIMDMAESIFVLLKTNYIFQAGLILFVFLLCAGIYKNKKYGIKEAFLIVTLVPLLVQIFVYAYMGRYVDVVAKTFPPRIITMALMGFWICLILVEACCEDTSDLAEKNRTVNIMVIGLSLVLCFLVLIQIREEYKLKGFSLKNESMIEDAYSYLNDGHVYVMDWKAYQIFMFEYRCWQNPPQGYLDNITLLGGCEINYPPLVEKERKLGLSNPYRSLYENENVYLVSTEYPDIELNYLRDVYDESIECEIVKNCEMLDIYKFVCH